MRFSNGNVGYLRTDSKHNDAEEEEKKKKKSAISHLGRWLVLTFAYLAHIIPTM